jgi:hypothetical protein
MWVRLAVENNPDHRHKNDHAKPSHEGINFHFQLTQIEAATPDLLFSV